MMNWYAREEWTIKDYLDALMRAVAIVPVVIIAPLHYALMRIEKNLQGKQQ